jgi:hypothetical protein
LPPRGQPDQRQERRNQHARQAKEPLEAHAPQKQQPHGDRDNHDEGAQVGLKQQQKPDQAHDHRHRSKALHELMHPVLLAHGIVGGVEHDKELHQLRGLQADHAQRDPAACTQHRLADAGNQHQDQQDQPGDKERARELLPALHGNRESQQAHRESDAQRKRMARQVMGMPQVRKPRRIGQRDRCGIDHDHAKQHERELAHDRGQPC